MIDPSANPPAAVLALLSERTRYDAEGNRFFADEDGSPIIDIHEPGCPNAGPRAAARYLHSRRPDLWAETKAAEAPVKPVAKPANTVEAMAAVRDGRMSVQDATAFMFCRSDPVPDKATSVPVQDETFTSLMAAARRGEPGAQARLDAKISGAFR
jgi:hypothetical protein